MWQIATKIMKKTTTKDFETFKTYCLKWQRELGLMNWNLYFEWKKNDEQYAGCNYSVPDGVATIALSKQWDDFRKVNKSELNRCALHEVLHILFAEFSSIAEERFTTLKAVDNVEHGIIHRLENALLGTGDA